MPISNSTDLQPGIFDGTGFGHIPRELKQIVVNLAASPPRTVVSDDFEKEPKRLDTEKKTMEASRKALKILAGFFCLVAITGIILIAAGATGGVFTAALPMLTFGLGIGPVLAGRLFFDGPSHEYNLNSLNYCIGYLFCNLLKKKYSEEILELFYTHAKVHSFIPPSSFEYGEGWTDSRKAEIARACQIT